MVDDKNPGERPSFFDFSDDEARSWPPAESHPTEEPKGSAEPASSDDFNIEDLFSDDLADPEPVKAAKPLPELDLIKLVPKPQESEEELEEESGRFESVTKNLEPEPDLIPNEPNESEFAAVEEDEVTEEIHEESVDALFTDYSAVEPSSSYKESSVETETLPFRTFTTYDYSEAGISEADLAGEDQEVKPGVNRNVLIVLATLLLIGGWYGFKSLTSKDYKANKGRERKVVRKKQKSVLILDKELAPVWDLSSQRYTSEASENEVVMLSYEEAGRDNPFMLPNSVLADMMKAAELELIQKQKPDTYRRKAYRATLIGVLTSTENTIALVDFQEAVFDVLEGTSKDKILKLATKAMDKSKENTQEMLVGSYIGPWKIVAMEAPKDAFIEPRITIENNGKKKVLNMGKAVELGIFDDDGNIDNLEDPVDQTALEEFEW